jgi:hypothetical protein
MNEVTRSGRLPQPQDPVEQESATRAAKRRKTISPSPVDVTVEQDVQQSNLEESAQEDLSETASGQNVIEASAQAEGVQEAEKEEAALSADDSKTEQQSVPAVCSPTTEAVDIAMLDRLADEILTTTTKITPDELGSAIKNPALNTGKQYLDLQKQFTLAKQKYSSAAFLSPPDLGSTGSTEICRKVNLATFVASLFDGRVSLEEIDTYFLFLFVPRGGTLSKLAGSLWVELKTQAFIASIVTGDQRPAATVLTILFAEDIRQRILDIRIGFDSLAESEEEFLESLGIRKAELSGKPSNLRERYRWEDFLKEAVSYIKVLKLDDGALTGSERLLLKPRQNVTQGQMERSSSQGVVLNGEKPLLITSGYLDEPEEDFTHKSARLALEAIQSVGQPYFTVPVPWPLVQYSTELASGPRPVAGETIEVSVAEPKSDTPVPHSSQTAPTLVLLSRARKASATEALHTNGEASKSWTSEEEETLLEELDRVQGALWSKILENETLKDRSEVQLKDKAQSLKKLFLLTGTEMPFFLKEATGVTNGSRAGSAAVAMKREE